MLFWVCVDDTPVALPTRDARAAEELALDHMNADPSTNVEIDVYGDSRPMMKLRYDLATARWVGVDALEP
jgi:hypothetical protein